MKTAWGPLCTLKFGRSSKDPASIFECMQSFIISALPASGCPLSEVAVSTKSSQLKDSLYSCPISLYFKSFYCWLVFVPTSGEQRPLTQGTNTTLKVDCKGPKTNLSKGGRLRLFSRMNRMSSFCVRPMYLKIRKRRRDNYVPSTASYMHPKYSMPLRLNAELKNVSCGQILLASGMQEEGIFA